jgi:heme o synthase
VFLISRPRRTLPFAFAFGMRHRGGRRLLPVSFPSASAKDESFSCSSSLAAAAATAAAAAKSGRHPLRLLQLLTRKSPSSPSSLQSSSPSQSFSSLLLSPSLRSRRWSGEHAPGLDHGGGGNLIRNFNCMAKSFQVYHPAAVHVPLRWYGGGGGGNSAAAAAAGNKGGNNKKGEGQEDRVAPSLSTSTSTVLISTIGDVNSSSSRSSNSSLLKAYSDLAKAKLSGLVVTTTAAGFVAGAISPAGAAVAAASSDPTVAALFVPCVVGTFLCSASASAVNQIVERDRDAAMKRTQARPLVTHALTLNQAKGAAAVWGVAGTSLLYCMTDTTTAALGAGNWFLYSVIYTSLKPRHVANTWVGAVVGAIPPVMGYSAATSGMLLMGAGASEDPSTTSALLMQLFADGGGAATAVAVPSWAVLAAALYWWQLPHFFALSYMHRKDYARGGFQMVSGSVKDANGDWTAQCITRYTWYMATLPLVSTALGITTSMFALEGMVLNGFALRAAYKFDRDRTNANARKVFLTSLGYLPCWLMLFLLHSTAWDQQTTEQEEGVVVMMSSEHMTDEHDHSTVMARLTSAVRSVRSKGREMCLHEAWATAPSQASTAPVLDAEAIGDVGAAARTAEAAGAAVPRRRPDACPIVLGTQRTHQGANAVRSAASDAAASSSSSVVTTAAEAAAAGLPLVPKPKG